MSYTVPFSFDRYYVTATLTPASPQPRDGGPKEGREAAWRHLRCASDVSLEVRVPRPDANCTLLFDNGRYAGYRLDDRHFSNDSCEEHDRFLEACVAYLEGRDGGGDPCARLEGVAREVVSDLVT